MNNAFKHRRLLWPMAQFAFKQDSRFSYCLHIPEGFTEDPTRFRLLVAVHGTGRACMAYRDTFAPFAAASDYVLLAPLFPVGVMGDDNADGYKYMLEHGLRYDHLLLGMVAELEEMLEHSFGRFDLFGFSGGAHFAHRFYYLQPQRLRSVIVGAPGGVTLLDDTRDYWMGTRDWEARFAQQIDVTAMRDVHSMLLVGGDDTQEFTYPPALLQHAPDMALLGRNRIERNATLHRNWLDHDLPVQRQVVPGIAHAGLQMVPHATAFLSRLPREGTADVVEADGTV
ncbi:alpha/beta hydrolase [Sphingomonas sp. 2SG]|uniref:alpha/beta fold hydrolase n=1 Tax=Sphingomonas sp. 2SG TaxID=2502201 RepID=UPI0010F48699|nr:alpha/beta hydrolase [Sphingomonas sp. 2SG]